MNDGGKMEEAPTCRCPLSSVCRRGQGPFQEHRRHPQQILYLQGEDAERVYLLRKGSVSLHRMGREDHALGLTRELRRGGSFLGLEALIDGEYKDSAKAETPVQLCSARIEDFRTWLGPEPSASVRVIELLLRAEEHERVQHGLPDLSARQRVCHWLLQRREQAGSHSVSRKVIAELLGMRPETLSRVLRELADAGLVEVSRRHIMIVDPEGLHREMPAWAED